MVDETVAHLLREGDMEVHGRIAGSSNATLLVTCRSGPDELMAVYKPVQGERPLWDFPGGLFRREVAAYELSEALGWGLVPMTVDRVNGPYGQGSIQRFVHEDGGDHYFTLRDDPQWHPTLQRMCAFDVVANNADRKSGHVLLAEDRLWAIDNGLCFNEEDKLRTVIWDFGGQPLEPEVIEFSAGTTCAPHPGRTGSHPGAGPVAGASGCAPRIGGRRGLAAVPVAVGVSTCT